MKNYSSSPRLNNHSASHSTDRNSRKRFWFLALGLRFSLRDYGFCMATLLLFCLGSLFYQLNGGPPKVLLEIRQYLGESTFVDDHGPPTPRELPFPSQVIYNRVGKCGSRTVVLLLRILAEKHQFNLVSSDIHNKTRLTKHEQVDLMRNISTIPQPFLYTRHVHFLNFTRFRIEQPVYINIIRDPINRFLSNYFFRRFGDWRGEQNHLIRTPQMKDDERYLPGVWAVERAKQNVIENFLLVGILEELEDVLLLLERLLPHYFSDVLTIYKSPAFWKMGNLTGTVKKHMPTLEGLQVLYQRMKYEYDFYNFIRDQFHLTKKKIGLKSTSQNSAHEPHFLRELALRTHEPLEEEEEEEEEEDVGQEDANIWLVQP
ncbi:uronyl 2-sulfotransferase [Sinocyclocheilus grahami]|uniref:uronyl 2-sulfotransferase n=1 Tax=Sinocyclocheilus grahami TaxID=75366 RepID=UPI0007AC670D|nr:PREDICTED: uronyl 2-sulfotransferase [Sinocyclocheilus grahami]